MLIQFFFNLLVHEKIIFQDTFQRKNKTYNCTEMRGH